MGWWHQLRYILRKLDRNRADRELDEEIRTHLEMEAQLNTEDGLSQEEARYAAMRLFGGEARAKERSRSMWGLMSLSNFWQNFRYCLRTLAKNPGFTAVVVLTLALGIGANTVIFSVVDAVLLRPLPYREPDRLVEIFQQSADGRLHLPSWSLSALEDWQNQTQLFEEVEASSTRTVNLTGGSEPQQITGSAISVGLFPLIGAQPRLGRSFLPSESDSGNSRVVILSDGLWRESFGADSAILGKTIRLNDAPYTVVGVMSPDFVFQRKTFKLWVPLVTKPTTDAERKARVELIARLRPGLSIAAADEQVRSLSIAHNREEDTLPGSHPELQSPDAHRVNAGPRRAILILFWAVGFVLLIACVNAANLMLSRSAVREREMAIRAALGAKRWRLIQQMLTESTLLAFLGGTFGILLSILGTRAIVSYAPRGLTFLAVNDIVVEQRVLVFTLVVSYLVGLAVGLIPALSASRPDLKEALNGLTRSATMSRGHSRLRSALIVVEVSLSFILLVGAGLMMRSFLRLSSVPLGFDVNNVLTVWINLPRSHYPTLTHQREFFDQLKQRVSSLPGVDSVSVSVSVPQRSGFSWDVEFEVEGRQMQKLGQNEFLSFNSIDHDYFHVLRIPLLRGRNFSAEDTPNSPAVTIINDVLARRLFSDEDPIGKRIRTEKDGPWMTVVGVVGHVKAFGLDDAHGSLEWYDASSQSKSMLSNNLIIRTTSDPTLLARSVKDQVKIIDPNQPIQLMITASQLIDETLSEPRFYLMLMSIFAACAILLASIGIYGVISYSVAQRRQEIGVRLALGAQPLDILQQVLRQGMLLIIIGIAIGTAGSLALTRLIKSLLFEVSTTDPLTFALIALLLIAVAILTCYVPARRASRLDPLVALRYE